MVVSGHFVLLRFLNFVSKIKTRADSRVVFQRNKNVYETMLKSLKSVDLRFVVEDDDNTNLSGELACAGGACEIK